MGPNYSDNGYNVDGFQRRPEVAREPEVEPQSNTRELIIDPNIIELSSDDEDSNQSSGLDRLPLQDLIVKQEQLEKELQYEDNSNEMDDTDDFVPTQSNIIPEQECQNVVNESIAKNDTDRQTHELLGNSTHYSSGIGAILNNYDSLSDDDFELDITPNQNRPINNTVSTPKVQFRMKSEKLNQNKPIPPLQNVPENNDDTIQTVADAGPSSLTSMYHNAMDQQFHGENAHDQFSPNADNFSPYTQSAHAHKPEITQPANHNENIKPYQIFDGSFDGENSNQFYNQHPSGNGSATPAHPAPIKQIAEEVLKTLEERGYTLVPKAEYDSLRDMAQKIQSPHHISTSGDQNPNKRHSVSPTFHSDGYGSESSTEKRYKPNHEYHRSSSSTKSDRHRDYHRSSSNSSNTQKSSHRTSTVTSGSYQSFRTDSSVSEMDYENSSSSNSNSTIFKQPSVEKERTSKPSTSDVQFKYKSHSSRDQRSSSHGKGSSSKTSHSSHRSHDSTKTKSDQHKSSTSTSKRSHKSNGLIKNTDRGMYLKSEKAKMCPICNRKYVRMVSHMKSVHTNYEVFVSRVRQEMVDKMMKGRITTTKYLRAKTLTYLKAFCIFCEEEKDFTPYYWGDHIRSHTGEYAHECTLCCKRVCFKQHCGMPTHKCEDYVDLFTNNMYAFLCKECNYIQIDKNSVRIHLRDEHNINDELQYEKYLRKITLLPALKSIPFAWDSNEKRAHGSRQPGISNFEPQPVRKPPPLTGVQVLENVVIRPASGSTTATTDEILLNEQVNASMQSNEDNQASNDTTNGTVANGYKIDPETENALFSAYEHNYDKTHEYTCAVRPWIESDYACKPIIDIATQFALYKCMHSKCLYSTDDAENWKKHMDKHIDLIDVLDKRGVLNPDIRKDYIKFRECPYCPMEEKANFKVIAHMEEHCQNSFQCAYCFYRSIEVDSAILHHNTHHSGKPREILLCNEEVEFDQKHEEQLKSNRDENIAKFKCGQASSDEEPCEEEFTCFNRLLKHLKDEHPYDPNDSSDTNDKYSCPYCMEGINRNVNEIQHHLIENCSSNRHFKRDEFNELQCIYCKKGFADISDIRLHMSTNHASNFLFIGTRRTLNLTDDEDDAQIVYIGNSQKVGEFSFYKSKLPKTFTLIDPSELNVQKQYEKLLQNQNFDAKEVFLGVLPCMKLADTVSGFNYVTYEDYAKWRRRSSQCVDLAAVNEEVVHPVNQAIDMPDLEWSTVQVPNVSPKVKTPIEKSMKFESGQAKSSPHQSPRTAPMQSDTPVIKYKCVIDDVAKDLDIIGTSSFKGLMCKDCNIAVRDLISHLMNDNDHACTHVVSGHPNEPNMIQHRKKAHSQSATVYLQEEKTEHTLVYKLVRCQFKCLAKNCNKQFENVYELKKHHEGNHLQFFLRSSIVQNVKVIQSNDPNQPVSQKTQEVTLHYLCSFFWCNRHNKTIGTTKQALAHHNDCHLNKNFEFTIKSMITQSLENDDHVQIVFQCEHCSKFFDKTESIQAHIEEIRRINPLTALYTIKRLLACPEDKIVSTFTGLEQHYRDKHPNKKCSPINPINPKLCGLCRDSIRDVGHYKRHQKGEVVGNVLLKRLKLDDFDLANCKFAPGCCDMNFDVITSVINHVATCRYRMTCDDCGTIFQQSHMLAEHRQLFHKENITQVLNNIHDIKKFINILSDMRIIFPNGFVVTKAAIDDTKLGQKLSEEIAKPITDVFEREKPKP